MRPFVKNRSAPQQDRLNQECLVLLVIRISKLIQLINQPIVSFVFFLLQNTLEIRPKFNSNSAFRSGQVIGASTNEKFPYFPKLFSICQSGIQRCQRDACRRWPRQLSGVPVDSSGLRQRNSNILMSVLKRLENVRRAFREPLENVISMLVRTRAAEA